jgi:CheY-like chemotaxis protein
VSGSAGRILVVEDDAGIVDLVREILEDEGYELATLRDRRLESVRAAVERLRPDCVLLDGVGRGAFGTSWADAAWMTGLPGPVPVVMFSGDREATDEAHENESERSRAAGFSAVVSKPFDLDELVGIVKRAVGESPFRDA